MEIKINESKRIDQRNQTMPQCVKGIVKGHGGL